MKPNRQRRMTSASARAGWFAAAFAALLLTLVAGPAFAHVGLDAPNGGEVLEAGSVTTIAWHDVINHGPSNFDLYYSTTGSDGPWTTIAQNLVFDIGLYSFDWVVPSTPSDRVRVRVVQDNDEAPNYNDISDADLEIVTAAGMGTVVLEPSRDATLYEGDGSLANGAGSYLFAGRTDTGGGSAERRAVLAFDVANALPTDATIVAVSLELTMSRTVAGSRAVELHKVLEAWSEGSSDAGGEEGGGASAGAGDVTWVHRTYPDSLWSSAGGAFSSAPSASLEINGPGRYTYSAAPGMASDVQSWIDDPSNDHGWILAMPSADTGSAKRFDSRENSDEATRPRLTVAYETSIAAPTAAFDFTPSNPRAGEAVMFSDQSAGSPTGWSWDFGDGGTSDAQNPAHVFANSGDFTVSLTASNAGGSDSTSSTVTVLAEETPDLTEMVLLPAAANAEGDVGSFFVTTADVHNSGASSAAFRLLWLPRGNDNSAPTESALYRLEPGETLRFDNLLLEAFGVEEAVGAVAALSDSPDLKIMSRTFNQSDQGTFGQSIPGVAEGNLTPAGARVRILFLTENEAFRSNLGLVNGTDSSLTIQWELFAADGTSLRTGSGTLPPMGNTQLNRVLADFAPIAAAYADVWTDTGGGAFACYGSVLDEVSSDPTTVLPQ